MALLGILFFAANSAFSEGSAPAAASSKPSILTDSLTGPCDPQAAGADLVPGTDVDGQPVAPADLAHGPIPLSGQIAVPLKPGHSRAPAYVMVDGAKLDPLLNPPKSCGH